MPRSTSYFFPLAIIALLFFVFGFLMWINGILIPYFQICLQLTNTQASLVSFAAYIAYFVMALPSAAILRSTGYKKGMAVGLLIMAAGTVLFIPAAYTRTYALFLTGLFITGSGVTLLQTAVNPYVAKIGPIESTAQRIGFMGLANKFAGIISIAVLGSIFLFDADNVVSTTNSTGGAEKSKILDAYALKIVDPYLVITIVLVLLAAMIFFSPLPEINDTENAMDGSAQTGTTKRSIFQYPYLILGVLALFVSGACEGLPIDCIVLYSRALGLPIEEARHFSQYTLYAMVAGYFASTILIPKYLSQHQALKWCSLLGLAFTIGSYLNTGPLSIYFLILTGFGAAMLWGTIWGLAIRDLGSHTKTGSAVLLMSVVGGGVFPLLFGKLIDDHPLHAQTAVLLLIPCYLILLLFSVRGYKLESWKGIARVKMETIS